MHDFLRRLCLAIVGGNIRQVRIVEDEHCRFDLRLLCDNPRSVMCVSTLLHREGFQCAGYGHYWFVVDLDTALHLRSGDLALAVRDVLMAYMHITAAFHGLPLEISEESISLGCFTSRLNETLRPLRCQSWVMVDDRIESDISVLCAANVEAPWLHHELTCLGPSTTTEKPCVVVVEALEGVPVRLTCECLLVPPTSLTTHIGSLTGANQGIIKEASTRLRNVVFVVGRVLGTPHEKATAADLTPRLTLLIDAFERLLAQHHNLHDATRSENELNRRVVLRSLAPHLFTLASSLISTADPSLSAVLSLVGAPVSDGSSFHERLDDLLSAL